MATPGPRVPVKETSASLSCPSSWTLSLSDLELPRARFMLRKYWPQRCRPASFLSLFSLARRFWNHTWGRDAGEWPPGGQGQQGGRGRARAARGADLHDAHVQAGLGRELFAHMARWLGRRVVGALERLQLLGGDGRARPLGRGLSLCIARLESREVGPASPAAQHSRQLRALGLGAPNAQPPTTDR